MSEETVKLVLRVQPGPDVDLVQFFSNDETWDAFLRLAPRRYHPDFQCAFCRFDTEETYAGLEGLRALWLDWLTPWATYRTEIDDAIDFGDRVLLLFHDFGRGKGERPTGEVRGTVAAIWTVRDGKVSRADFYPNRADALKATGLEE